MNTRFISSLTAFVFAVLPFSASAHMLSTHPALNAVMHVVENHLFLIILIALPLLFAVSFYLASRERAQ
jgi:cadmium resistance protein CadD (predicted permease)